MDHLRHVVRAKDGAEIVESEHQATVEDLVRRCLALLRGESGSVGDATHRAREADRRQHAAGVVDARDVGEADPLLG